MPRQRFIHPELWTDPSLGQLTPTERLFFIGCFSNADDDGRLLGNAAFLRSTIFPYDDISIGEIEAIRERVTSACHNLVYYRVDGIEYLAFTKWAEYQKPKYPKPSKHPAPPENRHGENMGEDFSKDGESLPENSAMGWVGLGRDGFGMGRGDEPTPCSANLPESTENERAILHELKQVPGYPLDYEKDLALIRELATDFPVVDLLVEAKKWRTYKIDKPLTKKSNPRLQLRNWCEIATGKIGQAPRAPTKAQASIQRYLEGSQ